MEYNRTQVERQYVAAMLSNGTDFYTQRRDMANDPSVIRDPHLKIVFETIVALRQEGVSAQTGTILNRVQMLKPDMDRDKWSKYLTDLFSIRPATIAEFRSVEKILGDIAREERIAALPRQIQAIASDENLPIGERHAKIRNIMNVAFGQKSDENRSVDNATGKAIMDDWLAQRKKDIANKTPLMCFPPHFGLLHSRITQLKPGYLVIIGGDTGAGKSTFTGQLADWLAMTGFPGVFIHNEDPFQKLAIKRAARLTGGTVEEIERGDPNNCLSRAAQIVDKTWAKTTYFHAYGMPAIALLEKIHAYCQDPATRPRWVVVDYLQKILDAEMLDNKTIVGGYFTNALKALAEEYEFLAILVTQESSHDIGTSGRKAKWVGDVNDKGQIGISIRSLVAEEDEAVTLPTGERVTISKKGDQSAIVQVVITKANDYRIGREHLVNMGGLGVMASNEFLRKQAAAEDRGEQLVIPMPSYKDADEKFLEINRKMIAAWRAFGASDVFQPPNGKKKT